MKNGKLIILFSLLSLTVFGQNITNSLGTSGIFTVKNGASTYLSLSQSTGNLTLSSSLELPNTTGSGLGVIYKGSSLFLHNYGTSNMFGGVNSGNLTMTGTNNSAYGTISMTSNTTGSGNTAIGNASLQHNETGDNNTAIGTRSLQSNIDGSFNTALGFNSLNINLSGRFNTAVGYSSLFSDTGSHNTALGYLSLQFNLSGSSNTAIGSLSMQNNSSGQNNTALGFSTASSLTTGSNNTLIGNDAEPTSSAVSNQITLGNNQITSLRCNVTTMTSLSDARDKKNINDLSLGIDFLMKLKPRQFHWDKREWYDDNISDGSKMQETPTAGFIAQELDEVQTSENAEWLNLVLKDNPEKWEATPGNLFPIVVKAIQQLKEENENLRVELEELRSVKEKVQALEKMINELNQTKEIISVEK